MAKKSKRTAARSRKRKKSAKKAKAVKRKKPRKKSVRKKVRRPSFASSASVATRKLKPLRGSVAKIQLPSDAPAAATAATDFTKNLADVREFFEFHLGSQFENTEPLPPLFPSSDAWTNLRVNFFEDEKIKYNYPANKWQKQDNSCIALANFMTSNPKYRQK
jgi:hypothetical protein